jgi:hypothetical protein
MIIILALKYSRVNQLKNKNTTFLEQFQNPIEKS